MRDRHCRSATDPLIEVDLRARRRSDCLKELTQPVTTRRSIHQAHAIERKQHPIGLTLRVVSGVCVRADEELHSCIRIATRVAQSCEQHRALPQGSHRPEEVRGLRQWRCPHRTQLPKEVFSP